MASGNFGANTKLHASTGEASALDRVPCPGPLSWNVCHSPLIMLTSSVLHVCEIWHWSQSNDVQWTAKPMYCLALHCKRLFNDKIICLQAKSVLDAPSPAQPLAPHNFWLAQQKGLLEVKCIRVDLLPDVMLCKLSVHPSAARRSPHYQCSKLTLFWLSLSLCVVLFCFVSTGTHNHIVHRIFRTHIRIIRSLSHGKRCEQEIQQFRPGALVGSGKYPFHLLFH